MYKVEPEVPAQEQVFLLPFRWFRVTLLQVLLLGWGSDARHKDLSEVKMLNLEVDWQLILFSGTCMWDYLP